jgi:hypothetical protein
MCSPYATPGTIAANLKQYGAAYRQCYSWLGPNQQGVNEADPTNAGGCVPDPGGAPPGHTGPQTSAKACPPGVLTLSPPSATSAKTPAKAKPGSGAPTPSTPTPGGAPSLQGALGTVTKALGGATTPTVTTPKLPTPTISTPTISTPTTPSLPVPQSSSNAPAGTPSAQQAQQLLNYLLSP